MVFVIFKENMMSKNYFFYQNFFYAKWVFKKSSLRNKIKSFWKERKRNEKAFRKTIFGRLFRVLNRKFFEENIFLFFFILKVDYCNHFCLL